MLGKYSKPSNGPGWMSRLAVVVTGFLAVVALLTAWARIRVSGISSLQLAEGGRPSNRMVRNMMGLRADGFVPVDEQGEPYKKLTSVGSDNMRWKRGVDPPAYFVVAPDNAQPIPALVHYVKGDTNAMSLTEYTAIRSAMRHITNVTVILHVLKSTPPTNSYLVDLISRGLIVRPYNTTKVDQRLKKVNKAITNPNWAVSHYSDFARVDLLYNQGGIYLDTDIIILASLDPLLHSPVPVISREQSGILNPAASMSPPKSAYAKILYENIVHAYDHRCWSCHITHMASHYAGAYPDLVQVLGSSTFHPGKWQGPTNDALLYGSDFFPQSFGIHVFGSNRARIDNPNFPPSLWVCRSVICATVLKALEYPNAFD